MDVPCMPTRRHRRPSNHRLMPFSSCTDFNSCGLGFSWRHRFSVGLVSCHKCLGLTTFNGRSRTSSSLVVGCSYSAISGFSHLLATAPLWAFVRRLDSCRLACVLPCSLENMELWDQYQHSDVASKTFVPSR
ncbi:hypothetical protein LY76DRAFT_129468 [Colletotrichum caudatum]|nr:hypothetical protein LY76DRAFT_129468 [Colletotrichum caudatum]